MNLITSELTTEEEILLKKYAKLRKKKKALNLRLSKSENKDNESHKRKNSMDSDLAGIDEQAKKLAKLAAMKEALENKEKNFKRPVIKIKKSETKTEYKRFDGMETSPQITTNQPNDDSSAEVLLRKKEDVQNQYSRFQKSSQPSNEDSKTKGFTIFVRGLPEFTEENIKRIFAVHGTILNIKIEQKRAFVCFELKESMDMAIQEVNNRLINNAKLNVGVAKWQPIFSSKHNLDDPASSDIWTVQNASNLQKGNLEESRKVISYDDDLFG